MLLYREVPVMFCINGFEIVLIERKAVVVFLHPFSFSYFIVLCAVVIADFDIALCDRQPCALMLSDNHV